MLICFLIWNSLDWKEFSLWMSCVSCFNCCEDFGTEKFRLFHLHKHPASDQTKFCLISPTGKRNLDNISVWKLKTWPNPGFVRRRSRFWLEAVRVKTLKPWVCFPAPFGILCWKKKLAWWRTKAWGPRPEREAIKSRKKESEMWYMGTAVSQCPRSDFGFRKGWSHPFAALCTRTI